MSDSLGYATVDDRLVWEVATNRAAPLASVLEDMLERGSWPTPAGRAGLPAAAAAGGAASDPLGAPRRRLEAWAVLRRAALDAGRTVGGLVSELGAAERIGVRNSPGGRRLRSSG